MRRGGFSVPDMPETLILPRFFNDPGGPFFLPTITGNGPSNPRSFHVICTVLPIVDAAARMQR